MTKEEAQQILEQVYKVQKEIGNLCDILYPIANPPDGFIKITINGKEEHRPYFLP